MNFNKILKKMDKWQIILLTLIISIIICQIYNFFSPSITETFISETEKYITHTGPDIYDNFYTKIYDDLLFSNVKNNYEIGEIINKTTPTNQSKILDIGCGTGHHVGLLDSNNISVIGIDNSPAMIEISKQNYPKSDFRQLDAMSSMIFQANSFTHILCLYFTIYYLKDKQLFFQNCYNWLMPGGHLIIHLVDRDMFDPILPSANTLNIVSPQYHAKKRITNSSVVFDNMKYKANFDYKPDEDSATFLETFVMNNNNKIRQNEHKLYMPTQKEILAMAKNIGFILSSKIDLSTAQYEYQYLYILQKPE